MEKTNLVQDLRALQLKVQEDALKQEIEGIIKELNETENKEGDNTKPPLSMKKMAWKIAKVIGDIFKRTASNIFADEIVDNDD